MSLIFAFFSNLFYYIALIVLLTGVGLYLLSYVTKLIPMLGKYALIMQLSGVLFIFGGTYYVADHNGYQRRVTEDQAEIDRLNAEARAKEEEVTKKFAEKDEQLRKAKNEIKSKQDAINSRIDSGELRLPSSCTVQASADTSTGDTNKGSESDRQAIKDIVAIATEGDEAILERNQCVAKYEEVRRIFNESR